MTKHETPKHEQSDAASGGTASMRQKLKIPVEEELLTHPSYEELQTKLTDAEKKAEENWDRALRIQAEMDNLRRRVERDIENAHKYSLEKFVNELLPVIDNLERSSLDDSLPPDNHFREGVALTLKMFISTMEKFGAQQINPEGQPFNPEFHQAVSTVVNADMKPNTVVSVLQKGYLLNGRLVRPAMVVVSKAT